MKPKKKYIAIVKISNNVDGTAKCLKYRFDNLLKFTQFLDKKWSQWKWFNLYSNRDENKGNQIGNFTKNNKPTTKYI
jgi:hypothetical protein